VEGVHKRGGSRKGAGRPKKATEELKKKTFSLPLSVREQIERQSNGTKYIIDLVRADIDKPAIGCLVPFD